MKKELRRLFVLCLLAVMAVVANAQVIKGIILDADTGDSLAAASISYKGNHVATIADRGGNFAIQRHEGWKLTFSAVGYKSQTLTIGPGSASYLMIYLESDTRKLDEVVVKSKKRKYDRKDNPAVLLMKRVIAAKKQNKIENKDFYQYRNYEKLTLANVIRKERIDSGVYGRVEHLRNQIQYDSIAERYTMPVITTEKVSHIYYDKEQNKTKTVIEGERSAGINELLETGEMFTSLIKDIFTEVDIYDENVRLLRNRFLSPISNGATDFYRYYIVDTVQVDKDQCIQLTFLPNNQQDFGFRGDIWVVNDSSLHVRRVKLDIPRRSDVNFVKTMNITQEYEQLPTGDWVLTLNDMDVDVSITGKSGNMFITRTSRRSDYSFDPIEKKIFHGKANEVYDPYAQMRDNNYWAENRDVEQTKGEAGMGKFIEGIKKSKAFGWIIFGAKAVLENFIETSPTGKPSYVDIGPFNSTFSSNSIDGFRLKPGFQTTANLHPHLFLKGYYAHAFRSKNNYYSGTLTYSFNKKMYSPQEFPRRNLSFTSAYDISSASDKFMLLDKDNVFAAWKWSKTLNMAYYNRQQLEYEHETDWGFAIKGGVKTEKTMATGSLFYTKMNEPARQQPSNAYNSDINGSFRTSELYVQLTFSPGQRYLNAKMDRFPLNREAPIFKLKHTWGIKGFLGGDYNYHVTEFSAYKRFWLKGLGKLDAWAKAGVQWNKVPFPLLIAPAANLSYIRQKEMFYMINNMEFLNDKFVSVMAEWDLQGKVLNRIPLLKKLKLREHIGFNMLWGSLSDKNNPTLQQNAHDPYLMRMPQGSHIMNVGEPYFEMNIGIHNIIKVLRVDYVRRFNYMDQTTFSRHSFRLGFEMNF